MKPSSAMALAWRRSGHSALACAFAGTGVVVAIVIAASAAERRRSRFVNMVPAPLLGMFVFARSAAGAEAPARRQCLLSRHTDRYLRLHDRRRIPFPGQRLRLRAVEAHGQFEVALRPRKPAGFRILSGTFVLEIA